MAEEKDKKDDSDGKQYSQAEMDKAIRRRQTALEEAREAREALKRMEDEHAEKERKQKEEEGKYKQLYEDASEKIKTLTAQLDAAKEEGNKFASILEDAVNAELAAIPEDRRALVPDSLKAVDKLQYIAKNRTLLSTAKEKGEDKPPDSNQRSGPQDTPSDDKKASIASALADTKVPLGTRIANALSAGSREK